MRAVIFLLGAFEPCILGPPVDKNAKPGQKAEARDEQSVDQHNNSKSAPCSAWNRISSTPICTCYDDDMVDNKNTYESIFSGRTLLLYSTNGRDKI